MNDTYLKASLAQSKALTEAYSSSFSGSLKLVDARLRPAIYAVYGMVRLADEIVDSPEKGIDISAELKDFRAQLDLALKRNYSTNLILHSFQWAYHTYNLKEQWIDAFFTSMAMDLEPKIFTEEMYQRYIDGSARIIGIMCLPIFCDGYPGLSDTLESGAARLGAGYQKINFLRDIAADYREKGRCYFPGLTPGVLRLEEKKRIEADVAEDFTRARSAILHLPLQARRGVYLSYLYFTYLLKKIAQQSPEELFSKRVSVSRAVKIWVYIRAVFLF